MKLSTETVRALINELHSVIEYNLNIMDEEGIIISSTDPSRIGQFHEAALLIINENLPSLLVHYDNEYSGCKEGTNVPLIVDDEIIGVVGITGDVNETSKYANIIKKTAEILLKDYAALSERTRLDEARMSFLNSWLNGDISDSSRLKRKLEQYGCASFSTFQVVVIDNINGHDVVRSFLREKVKHARTVTTWNNSYGTIIGMFHSSEEIKRFLEDLLADMPDRDDYFFAVGDTVEDENLLNRSYNHAFSLLQFVKTRSRSLGLKYSGIQLYEDHILDIIMNQIPADTKKAFTAFVFDDVDRHTIMDIVPFILSYCECNGSINEIARKLFIHKNTVQYKIKRIRDLTGLDLRVNHDMIRLYAAAQWFLLTQ